MSTLTPMKSVDPEDILDRYDVYTRPQWGPGTYLYWYQMARGWITPPAYRGDCELERQRLIRQYLKQMRAVAFQCWVAKSEGRSAAVWKSNCEFLGRGYSRTKMGCCPE